AGQASLYATTGAPANATGALLISLEGSPSVPAFGGTLVALSGLLGVVHLQSDAFGRASLPVLGMPPLGVDLVVQGAFLAPDLAQGATLSNAIRVRFGP
ncbi:MAG: hypothetical protein AB8H80_13750, partial [Planctomycetota bacterium]